MEAMRLLQQDEDYAGDDWAECPHCRAEVAELAGDVSDADCQSDAQDVAGINCPKCGANIALVREHSYYLRRWKSE